MQKILVLLILIFPYRLALAQEYKGNTYIRCSEVKDVAVSLSGCVDVYVEWEVGILMGEPVYSISRVFKSQSQNAA